MDAEERAGQRNTRLLLIVVVTAILISVLNQTFVNVVVPDIRQDYGATQGQAGWVITGYLLVFAVGIPLYGRIADLYSLRYTFALGLLLLAAGSLACALAPSLPLLVAGRVLQAAGASAIPALGFASVAKALPPGSRGTALGLLSSSVGAGAAIGPVLGGFVAGLTGWHVLFYLTLLLAALLIPGALYALPGTADGGSTKPAGFMAAVQHFDVPGGLSLALAAGLALFGVTQGQVVGFSSPISWGSFVAAGFLAAFFAWRIRAASDPFVTPHLFRNKAFLAASVTGFFMMFCNVGSLVLVPLLLSEVNGLSAAGIGLVLAPGALVVAVLSPIAGRLSDRFGPRTLVRVGLVVIGLSTFSVSAFAAGASAVAVAVGMLGLSVGFSMVNSPNANAAAASLSPEESGVGLGIYQMLFFLGGGFGPAVAATFLAVRQGSESGALNPLFVASSAPFSDAFLLLTAATVVSFVAAFGLKKSVGKGGKGGKDA
ncbi:DHA2 family efflux MFS transporter permease subunit [Rubrobacter tropicus]|uniref:DHA2 family efflux MFS transporter permease subunit n=2 Tax=Rubrobacter tropicus TaxID=2653851 RepID=A0A6G8QF10_9ACTN|nr:DHA2 family efflux MFS transporter permease subunit [Rubrobacter tropicus]